MPPTSDRHRLLAEPPFPGSQLSMTVLRLGTVVLSGSFSKGTVSASEYLSESPGCSCCYRGTSEELFYNRLATVEARLLGGGLPSPMDPPSYVEVMANVNLLELSTNRLLEYVARCAKADVDE